MVSDFMYGLSDLSAEEQEQNAAYGADYGQNEAPMSEDEAQNAHADAAQQGARTPAKGGKNGEKAGGYRVLAGIFALLAVGGLFAGMLGTWIAFLDPPYPLTGVLGNALLGYILYTLQTIFVTVGFGAYLKAAPIVSIVQLLLIATVLVAAVASVVLFVVSLCSRKAAKNCAVASGVLTTAGYFGLFLFNYCVRAVTSPVFSGALFASFDVVPGIFGGVALLILMVSAIVRRKGRGVLQCVQFVLPLAALFALSFPASALGQDAYVVFNIFSSAPFLGIALIFLTVMLIFDLVVSLIRLGAKRAYGLDCLRSGLLFLAVVLGVVAFMVQSGEPRMFLFTGGGQLLPTLILLCTSLASLIVGIVQFIIGPAHEENAEVATQSHAQDSLADESMEDYAPDESGYLSEESEPVVYAHPAELPEEAPAEVSEEANEAPAEVPQEETAEVPEEAEAPAEVPEEAPAAEPVAEAAEPAEEAPAENAAEEAPAENAAEVKEEAEEEPVEVVDELPLFSFEDLFDSEPEDEPAEEEPALEPSEEAVEEPEEAQAAAEVPEESVEEPVSEPETEAEPEPAAEPAPEPAQAPSYEQPYAPYRQPEAYPPYGYQQSAPYHQPQQQPYAPYKQPEAYPPYAGYKPEPAQQAPSYEQPYGEHYPYRQPQPVSPENAFTQWEREMAALAAGRAPEPAPQPAPQPQPSYQVPPRYARQYQQPNYFEGINQYTYDPFINSLTQQEKNEFGDIFIAHKNGRAKNLPVYVIGGDNDEFFRTVWIRYNSFGMSPSLKEKVYQYLTSKD